MKIKEKREKRFRRHRRIRSKIFGTAKVPRLFVFKSKKHIYTQLINDEKSKTIVSASDQELEKSKIKSPKIKKKEISEAQKSLSSKVTIAYEVGKLIAKKALNKKIEQVVFDRGGYLYHGKVKAVAEGAREEGLKF